MAQAECAAAPDEQDHVEKHNMKYQATKDARIAKGCENVARNMKSPPVRKDGQKAISKEVMISIIMAA